MEATKVLLVCSILTVLCQVAIQQGSILRVPALSDDSDSCGSEDFLYSVQEKVERLFPPPPPPTTVPPPPTAPPLTGPSHPCGAGYRQIAFIDMTDPRTTCPTGFYEVRSLPRRVCGVASDIFGSRPRCIGNTTFSTGNVSYSRVCGRIQAYMSGYGAGFNPLTSIYRDDGTGRGMYRFNGYMYGYSLVHGPFNNLATHIWTFISGRGLDVPNRRNCPCDVDSTLTVPSFVGNHYFCDSVNRSSLSQVPPSALNITFSDNVPLWDGQDCPLSRPCPCTTNSPPWFNRRLPSSTTDDILLQHCCSSLTGVPGSTQPLWCSTPFEQLELYVQ